MFSYIIIKISKTILFKDAYLGGKAIKKSKDGIIFKVSIVIIFVRRNYD